MTGGKLVALVVLSLAGFVMLAGLGAWQIRRLMWKRALIVRVETRIHAPPVAVPGPESWSRVTAREYEFRRVLMRGHYLYDRVTWVQAVTRLGAGYWAMTPFRTAEGYDVLVNRGFVPPALRYPAGRGGQNDDETTVVGLLRMSEPKGGFLRANDSRTNRWYSRDVAEIAEARGLSHYAPYFVDADRLEPASEGAPIGGLTVVSFPNDHLQYALTWFALASLIPGSAYLVFRHGRQGSSGTPEL